MNIMLHISCVILAATPLALQAQQPPATAPVQTPATPQTSTSTPPPAQAPAEPVTTGLGAAAQSSAAPSGALPNTSGAPAAVDSTHYIIGPDDVLQITVWREPTLSGSLPVRPDGMISMVLLGDLPAAGLTPTALGRNISERLHKYVQDPSVTVQVMGINSQKVYLIGEVTHVGAIPLTADMSPLKAIAAAGGLSPFANSKHIYILRGSGARQQKIPFNYKQALKGEDRQPLVLQPGDTIVIP